MSAGGGDKRKRVGKSSTPGKGKSRDKAAKGLGMSGRHLETGSYGGRQTESL